MTDKIDPGWVSDRLPTEEDANKEGVKNHVLIYNDDRFLYEHFTKIIEGQEWSISTDELWEDLATPEECLARSQEQSHECGECGQEWDGDGDSDCPLCNPTDNGREKIKELEIALKLSNSLRADAVSKLRKQREEKLDTDDLTINTLRGLCTKHEKKIKELEKALKDKEPYPSLQHWLAKTERLEKALEKSEERLSVTLSLHTHKMQDIVDLKANI